MTDEKSSVTDWIGELKTGDNDAIVKIWRRYYNQLVGLARSRMGSLKRRSYDEEDAALSAFQSFVDAVQDGRLPDLHDRHNLWRILILLTKRKISGRIKHEKAQKRGGGNVRGESVFEQNNDSQLRELENVMGEEPTPEFVAELVDELGLILDPLEESLREVAIQKMNGYNNGEIAVQLGITRRSVERKLERIRREWSKLPS